MQRLHPGLLSPAGSAGNTRGTVPSNANIRAAVLDALSLGISPADMVALIDRALADGLVEVDGSGNASASERPISLTIGGRTRTYASRKDLLEERTYWASRIGGGVISQGVEFA